MPDLAPSPARRGRGSLCVALLVVTHAATPVLAADEIHWTFTGPTSVSFDWRGAESVVHYGLTSAYGLDASAATPDPLPFSSAGPFWEARLTGLLPNTLYHYAIGGAPDHTFRTPLPRGASDFVVCVEGDIGDSTSYPRWVGPVQRLVAQQQPRFALLVGDLTYANDHGQAHVDQHFNDVMAWSLDAAYLPAWGNHEWDKTTDDFRNYKGRFDLPNPRSAVGAPSAGGAGEDWYWFDYGNARFIAYPEPFSGAWSAWSRSADSLMTAVDGDPEIRYIVTFGHRPAYSSGHHPGDNTLKGYLDQLGAKHPKYALDLCGHSHNYERTFPQSGVTHITNGGGGASLETDGSPPCTWLGGCPPPPWTAFRAFRHGALRLHFTATSIEGVALCGPSDPKDDVACTPGEPMDAFSIPAVIGGDLAPLIVCPGARTVAAGSPVTFEVAVSDPDGDSVTVSMENAPPGASLDGLRFAWTPDSSQAGDYSVVFRASDGTLENECSVAIHVQPAAVISDLVLEAPRPNPATDALTVGFVIPRRGLATISLYGVDSQLESHLSREVFEAGRHEVTWNGLTDQGRRLPAGIYYIRLEAAGSTRSRTVILLR